MYKNNSQNIVAKFKKGFQTAELILGDIKEAGGYSSVYNSPLKEQGVETFCVYSKKFIKIFKLELPYQMPNKNSNIHEINCEESLTWGQKILRFVSFGHLYSNKSNLLAQIYDEKQLSWWQRAINRVSFGYFYRTTAKIEGISFKYQSEYGDENYKRPALLRLEDVVDPEKSNHIKRQYKQDWVLFKNLQNINENPVKNNISSNSNALGGFPVLDVNNAVKNSAYNEIKTPNDINSNPYYPNMAIPPEDFEQNQSK